ncbi:hypothetical protein [Vibrio algicola]|uniref:Uncharacterized protein n=1 Tax=Vibrio algicola TaxID=2662262 RepID=A0A5Q0TIK5_9VIBR|nr:hypothetical protein [Vibrio algicola]
MPNVYVFADDGAQYYYNDDADFGNYTLYTTKYVDEPEAGTLQFNYYESDLDNPIDVNDASYTVKDDKLNIISTISGNLTGTDEAINQEVKDAVAIANEKEGIGATDDFDSYVDGTNISAANDLWVESDTIAEDDTVYSSVAQVSSMYSNSPSNSLYLEDKDGSKPKATRQFVDGNPVAVGSLTVDVYIPSDQGSTKGIYVNLGNGDNDNNSFIQVMLSTTSKSVTLRGGDNGKTAFTDIDQKLLELPFDIWTTIQFDWDGSSGSVTINGNKVTINETNGLNLTNTPSQLMLSVGDNSSMGNKAYFDNVDSDLF